MVTFMFGSNYTYRREQNTVCHGLMADSDTQNQEESRVVVGNGRRSPYLNTTTDQDLLWTGPKLKESTSTDNMAKLNKVEAKPATSVGVFSPHVLLVIVLWYIVSFIVLVLNKHILTTLKGDPVVLSKYKYPANTNIDPVLG